MIWLLFLLSFLFLLLLFSLLVSSSSLLLVYAGEVWFKGRFNHFFCCYLRIQLVWKSTKEIGAAQRVRRDKYLIVVIKYNPGGNVDAPGYYRDNVFPPRYPTNVTTNVTATTVTPLCNITVVVGNTTNATTTVIGVCPTTPLEPVVKAGSRCFRLSAFVGVLCLTIGGVAERVLVSF